MAQVFPYDYLGTPFSDMLYSVRSGLTVQDTLPPTPTPQAPEQSDATPEPPNTTPVPPSTEAEPTSIPDLRFSLYMTQGYNAQTYIDRYHDEPEYQSWFDANFGDMTIYEAVGVDEPTVPVPLRAPEAAAPEVVIPESPPEAPRSTPTPVEPEVPRPPPPAPEPAPPVTPPEAPVSPPPALEPAPPVTPPTPPPATDNSAVCDRLVAQLLNINISDEEFARVEAELEENDCGA